MLSPSQFTFLKYIRNKEDKALLRRRTKYWLKLKRKFSLGLGNNHVILGKSLSLSVSSTYDETAWPLEVSFKTMSISQYLLKIHSNSSVLEMRTTAWLTKVREHLKRIMIMYFVHCFLHGVLCSLYLSLVNPD